MQAIVSLIINGLLGLLALLGVIIIAALLFGKRVTKHWEYEAEFRDAAGREFGEFEIELSQIQKEEAQATIKADLKLRHEALAAQSLVRVYLDDKRVLEGTAERAGRVSLRATFGEHDLGTIAAGQECRVVVGETELAAAPLHRD